jgi:hypothetical protein
MRRYAKVAPQFWTGTTGRAIRAAGRDVQLVALYLISCPSANMIGLYYLPLPTLCHEVRISEPAARRALERLNDLGFASYDAASEHVFVREMARFQVAESLRPGDKQIPGIIRDLRAVRVARFVREFRTKYATAFHLENGIPSPLQDPSEDLRSQEQEQEHEQKQEPETGGHESDWPSPEALVALYHESIPAGHPRVDSLSPARRERARAYLHSFPDREFWRRAFAAIGRSALLQGRRPSPDHKRFRGDFDFFLRKGKDGIEHVVKASEGKYHDHQRVDDEDDE